MRASASERSGLKGDHDPHVLGPGLAPTPFTADEIRSGCPDGREVTMLVTGASTGPYLDVTRFEAGDALGVDIVKTTKTLGGEPISGPRRHRVEWSDLQAHAAFPAEATRISEETITIEAGTYQCLRYEVDREPTESFWFAKSLPGMPIKTEAPGHEGTNHSTEMISHSP